MAHFTRTQDADTHLGLHIADIATDDQKKNASLEFTLFWSEANRWEGRNFLVNIV